MYSFTMVSLYNGRVDNPEIISIELQFVNNLSTADRASRSFRMVMQGTQIRWSIIDAPRVEASVHMIGLEVIGKIY